ncbi:MAG: hypothetical protein ACRERV_13600 [Methylococcales bacterium]
MSEFAFIQYLRINYPYIWRSRIHVYLPLYAVTTLGLAWLGHTREFTLLDFPTFDEIYSKAWAFRGMLGLIAIGWLISLWKFPLKNTRPSRLAQTLLLYWICILVAGLGPRLYALTQIDPINRIPEVRNASASVFQEDLEHARVLSRVLCSHEEATKSGIAHSELLSKYGFFGKIIEVWKTDLSKCNNWVYDNAVAIQQIGMPYPSTELLFQKISTLIEVKNFYDQSASEFDPFRFLDTYFYWNTFLLAGVLLFLTSEQGMNFVGKIPDNISALFKIPYQPRLFEWLEDRYSRN